MDDLNQALLLLFRTEIGTSCSNLNMLLSGDGAGEGFVYHVFLSFIYAPTRYIGETLFGSNLPAIIRLLSFRVHSDLFSLFVESCFRLAFASLSPWLCVLEFSSRKSGTFRQLFTPFIKSDCRHQPQQLSAGVSLHIPKRSVPQLCAIRHSLSIIKIFWLLPFSFWSRFAPATRVDIDYP